MKQIRCYDTSNPGSPNAGSGGDHFHDGRLRSTKVSPRCNRPGELGNLYKMVFATEMALGKADGVQGENEDHVQRLAANRPSDAERQAKIDVVKQALRDVWGAGAPPVYCEVRDYSGRIARLSGIIPTFHFFTEFGASNAKTEDQARRAAQDVLQAYGSPALCDECGLASGVYTGTPEGRERFAHMLKGLWDNGTGVWTVGGFVGGKTDTPVSWNGQARKSETVYWHPTRGLLLAGEDWASVWRPAGLQMWDSWGEWLLASPRVQTWARNAVEATRIMVPLGSGIFDDVVDGGSIDAALDNEATIFLSGAGVSLRTLVERLTGEALPGGGEEPAEPEEPGEPLPPVVTPPKGGAMKASIRLGKKAYKGLVEALEEWQAGADEKDPELRKAVDKMFEGVKIRVEQEGSAPAPQPQPQPQPEPGEVHPLDVPGMLMARAKVRWQAFAIRQTRAGDYTLDWQAPGPNHGIQTFATPREALEAGLAGNIRSQEGGRS